MSNITINGLRATSVRIFQPYRGVPFVDVDVDPDVVQSVVTTGPAVIVIGAPPGPVTTITGVIDPLGSGTFVASARLRVLCGKGGWSKTVPAQHFHDPAGVLSTLVYNATAALVLETVADLLPSLLGPDYVRSAGPASRVFGDALWWVDPVSGLTSVGPRPPAVPDVSLEILSWDPLTQVATLTCDALVSPGTPLVDTRIGGTPVFVRDVDQVFDASGSRATAYVSPTAVSRLQSALTRAVRELGQSQLVKIRRYRFVLGAASALALQAVDRDITGSASPFPDLITIPEWTGMAGITAQLPPSLEVLVGFVDGDPAQPVVLGYSTLAKPVQLAIDASAAVNIGATAPVTTIGAAPQPVAMASVVVSAIGIVAGLLTAIGGLLVNPPTSVVFAAFAPAAGAIFTAAGSALAALAPSVPSKTTTVT